MIEKINQAFTDLPIDFRQQILPFVRRSNPKVATKPDELLGIWVTAIVCRQKHPDKQELIAEWAVSAAASSPLINDNDIHEAIHATFGALEFSPENADEAWAKLEHRLGEVGYKI